MRILISGGAGFVGSALALKFREMDPSAEIVALDNLRRRGSEINTTIFKSSNIEFFHGDIRNRTDLFDINRNFDLFIEASAEPSVLAGTTGSPDYVLQTNLCGTLNCLEFARQRVGTTLFLSTSRVYSIGPLRQIVLDEGPTRFEISSLNNLPGLTVKGISESFPTNYARSLYGGSKLASEIIAQEYADTYSMNIIINRCGVIAGPGQFGKIDQGVFTMWVANHFFKKPLKYVGFGGLGKQVRDLLHPGDLFDLIYKQASGSNKHSGRVFNVGGGQLVSTSLLEMTSICQEVTGNEVPVASVAETTKVDIPLYISDASVAENLFAWKPKKSVKEIVCDIYSWICKNKVILKTILG